jgi:hypothetical protein
MLPVDIANKILCLNVCNLGIPIGTLHNIFWWRTMKVMLFEIINWLELVYVHQMLCFQNPSHNWRSDLNWLDRVIGPNNFIEIIFHFLFSQFSCLWVPWEIGRKPSFMWEIVLEALKWMKVLLQLQCKNGWTTLVMPEWAIPQKIVSKNTIVPWQFWHMFVDIIN